MKFEQGTSNRLYTFNEYELAQHDLEVRKPLEDEIERLKKQLYLNDKEHFKNALKQLRETDYDTIRKIERLKVIAELEKEIRKLNIKLEIWNRFNSEDYIYRGKKITERDYYYYTNGASSVLENEYSQLKHDLAVRDRALDLACKKIEELRAEIYEYNEIKTEICKKLLFDQAEKELKGEKDE